MTTKAEELDGKDWKEIEPFIKTYNPVTGFYILKDGSKLKKQSVTRLTDAAEGTEPVTIRKTIGVRPFRRES